MKPRVWIAVCTCLMIAILPKQLKLYLDGKSITAPVVNDRLRIGLAQTGRQTIQVWPLDGK